uniref:CSN8/PSMD8/EIF3K domain-containing protein n=1 Tax=Lotharella globosa TaxID=91324 RepID=A0A7S4DF68_9EUKA
MDAKDLQPLLAAKRWDALVQQCLLFELRSASAQQVETQAVLQNAAILMIGHMLKDDAKAAHFVWKRIPDPGKKAAPYLESVWQLGKHLLLKDRRSFYGAVDNTKWPEVLVPFVDALRAAVRERMTGFIVKAYSSIQLKRTAELLGFKDAGEAKNYATSLSWRIEGDMVYPQSRKVAVGGAGLKLPELGNLSKYMQEFEMK